MTEVKVLDGIEIAGEVNTPDATIANHIAHSIKLGHPQMRPEGVKPEVVAIVGSGPSLIDTETELRDAVFSGAKVVALNGSLEWCIQHNIRPSAVVVVDARAENARFVARHVPGCIYYIASQCHPDVWQAVSHHTRVVIWHPVSAESEDGHMLDQFYGKRCWFQVGGGTTVATRAIALLRMSGYIRFELFGVDSCWMGDRHHAFDQAENEADQRVRIDIAPQGVDQSLTFDCAPWHLKQFEDFLQMIRVHGDQFSLRVHGDGLLAHGLSVSAKMTVLEGS